MRRGASCCECDYGCNSPRNNCTDQAPIGPASDASVHQAFEKEADGEFAQGDSDYHQDLGNIYVLLVNVSKQHWIRLGTLAGLTYLFE